MSHIVIVFDYLVANIHFLIEISKEIRKKMIIFATDL